MTLSLSSFQQHPPPLLPSPIVRIQPDVAVLSLYVSLVCRLHREYSVAFLVFVLLLLLLVFVLVVLFSFLFFLFVVVSIFLLLFVLSVCLVLFVNYFV